MHFASGFQVHENCLFFQGKTKCFNKFGYKLFECDSSLPGGGTRKSRKEGVTVLDCIFNSEAETFFILDMLVWNSVSFLDCEVSEKSQLKIIHLVFLLDYKDYYIYLKLFCFCLRK